MKIVREFKTTILDIVLQHEPSAQEAYNEVLEAIENNVTVGNEFVLNNSKKNVNGVTFVKEGIINLMHETYDWELEHPLTYLSADTNKGGPIDAFKIFGSDSYKVGFEFETGNVASVHRSINKLLIGITAGNLNMGVLILPMKSMSYYLTDRSANFEEIEPYLLLWSNEPLAVIGFEADRYDPNAPILKKGTDGRHNG